jgi:methyltransferase
MTLLPLSWLAVVFALVFVPMLVEAGVARRNEHEQLARGGLEPPGDVYQLMKFAYPVSFLAMILEGAARAYLPGVVVACGALIFFDAKILKLWAIRSLGRYWTFRVIVVPGAPLVSGGPYRFVRHPNYIAVLGELVGTTLMTCAYMSGPIVTVLFGGLMLRRIAVETRALEQYSTAPIDTDSTNALEKS